MKNAMISQPMGGKTDDEIVLVRGRAMTELEKLGYSTVGTLFSDQWYSENHFKELDIVNRPLLFLAESLKQMSRCHAVYFCKGWERARGCRIEHDAALAYGLDIIYEM